MYCNKFLLSKFVYHSFRMIVYGFTPSSSCLHLLRLYMNCQQIVNTRCAIECVSVPDDLDLNIIHFLNGNHAIPDLLYFEYSIWSVLPLLDGLFGDVYARILEFAVLNERRMTLIYGLHRMVSQRYFEIASPIDGTNLLGEACP